MKALFLNKFQIHKAWRKQTGEGGTQQKHLRGQNKMSEYE